MAKGEILVHGHYWDGKILWNSSPIPGENQSRIQADFYCDGYSIGTFCGDIHVGSVSQSPVWNNSKNNGFVKIGSITTTVSHDSEGNCRIYLSMRCYAPPGSDLQPLQGGGYAQLDHIDQAGPSRISFSEASVQMGKKLLISIDRDQPDCIHRLSYTMGELTGLIGDKVESSFQWTLPDLWQGCRNALSGVCTITCQTYRKDKLLGQTTGEITVMVPDPAVPELSQAVLGEASTVRCSRKSQGFSVSLFFLREDQRIFLGEGQMDSFSWTPDYALARLCPDLTGFSGLLEAVTSLGTARVGSRTCAISLTVPENQHTKPVISQFTLESILHGLPENFPLIRGKTGVSAKIAAESPVSQLGEISLTVGEQQAFGETAAIDYLREAGSFEAQAAVTDLRGFRTVKTLPLTVLAYDRPRSLPYEGFAEIVVSRAEDLESLSPGGKGLAIYAGLRHSEITKDGQDLNPAGLSYRIRKQGQSQYSSWKELISPGEKQKKLFIPQGAADVHSSYEVQLRAWDSLSGEELRSFSVMTEAVSFSLYDGVDGAAFGKYAEIPHVVEIAPHMTLRILGKTELPEGSLDPGSLRQPDQTLLTQWLRQWNLDQNFPLGRLWISADPQSPESVVGGAWKQVPAPGPGLYAWQRVRQENTV